MKTDSLAILKEILKLTDRSKRPTRLLRLPVDNQQKDWFMYVPSCFNEALDIKMTSRVIEGREESIWTQGSAFSFKEGDTIYNTPSGYSAWTEPLPFTFCLQAQEGKKAVPEIKGNKEDESQDRNPGFVTFIIYAPDDDRSKVVKESPFLIPIHAAYESKVVELGPFSLTQDKFVRFLIDGSSPNNALGKVLRDLGVAITVEEEVMDTITFKVQGSQSEPYSVIFKKKDDLSASCTCQAAQHGLACKHRLNILLGDTKGIVSGNSNEVSTISSWLQGTELESAFESVKEAEQELERAKKKVDNCKRRLSRLLSG